MALAPGTRLGPYEITAPLGAGGMGEVYRATDSTLGRDVAIKVLPESMAADPDRLARFDREAKTLAALNHPNIAAIYGVERSHGATALIMEFVPGETLAVRCAAGPVSVPDAIAIAQQIAGALDAAHEQGIVHRDLKPANIKLRPDGSIKVLDFGLAKAIEPGTALSGVTQSPTITSPAMTQTGVILGTAAYMSPEQSRGKPVDERADIWAFGCVVYEMLTARRAFDGEDVPTTLARVMEREPDYDRLPRDTPRSLIRIVRRCLAKNPRDRYRDVGDVQLDLRDALESPLGATALAARSRTGWAGHLPWLIAGALAAAVVALVVERGRSSPPAAALRTQFALRYESAIDDEIAISADGRHVVAEVQGKGLFVHDLATATVRFVKGTEGDATTPTLSPDGRWIAYVDQVSQELRRVAIEGGQPIVILKGNPGSFGMTWGQDDSIVFVTAGTLGLRRVPIAGGAPDVLTEVNQAGGEIAHWFPEHLPGGRRTLFTVVRVPAEQSSVEVVDLDTRERTVLLAGAYSGRYVESGHLVFMRGEAMWAVAFDTPTLRVTSEPTLVLPEVALEAPELRGAFAVSRNGTLAYITPSEWNRESVMTWVDRRGSETPAIVEPGAYQSPRLSPDARHLAFARTARGRIDVWVSDLTQGGNLVRVTGDEANVGLPRPGGGGSIGRPVWMPDGSELLYALPIPRDTLFRRRWQTGDAAAMIQPAKGDERPSSVSPDGRLLAFDRLADTWEIWLLQLDGSAATEVFRAGSSAQRAGMISPDGTWMAYESDETGRSEIWLEPIRHASGGARRQISRSGGYSPRWSRQGELFFQAGAAMTSVRVDLTAGTTGTPAELFRGNYRGFGWGYDVTGDGQRFLMLKPVPGKDGADEVTIVVNWLDELKRLVPAP